MILSACHNGSMSHTYWFPVFFSSIYVNFSFIFCCIFHALFIYIYKLYNFLFIFIQCENCEKITGGGVGKYGARRRRRRGGRGLGKRCAPPNRDGVWGGGCAPSRENFLTFWLKIVHFGIYSEKNSQFSIEWHHRIAR